MLKSRKLEKSRDEFDPRHFAYATTLFTTTVYYQLKRKEIEITTIGENHGIMIESYSMRVIEQFECRVRGKHRSKMVFLTALLLRFRGNRSVPSA